MSNTFSLLLSMIMVMFLASSHPLILVSETIMMTLLTSWFTTQLMSNSWVSLILILIWLGGLLIIFIYLSSLIPNEMMKFSLKILLFLIIFIFATPLLLKKESFFLKKIFLFSSMSFATIIPLILLFMIIILSVTIYLTSMMKNPAKQEMN